MITNGPLMTSTSILMACCPALVDSCAPSVDKKLLIALRICQYSVLVGGSNRLTHSQAQCVISGINRPRLLYRISVYKAGGFPLINYHCSSLGINSIQPLQTPLHNKNDKSTYTMASEQVPSPEKGVEKSSGVNQALAGLSLSSRGVHADDGIAAHRAVAPAMHVSTTFRYSDNPDELTFWNNSNADAPLDSHVYSRDSAPNTTRLEAILTSLLGAPSLTYSSGLSAFHAMLVHLNPKRIAIGDGYHGCHGVIKVLSRLNGLKQLPLDCAVEDLQPGDVIHVETPLNPTGEARDLEFYAEKARKAGAYLTVDATFAPPPLQDPFKHGVDAVMHSGTKYFGGHSDMLCGVLAVNPKHEGWIKSLREDRLVLGSVMGSLEGWLGIRSLRTFELRILRQSATATALVSWLAEQQRDAESPVGALVERIQHASLQPEAAVEDSWLRRQMSGGWGPVFSFYLKDIDDARRFPSKLHLFHHATSLGGVESLIEWRAMTDAKVDKRLLRVSIGVESLEDLKQDLLQGLEALKKEKSEK
ncbi:Cys/Met metabolism PLP-dependent enzyme-domain-containing protein [Thelonectria olida]|uniref:Cys/Met metabolism PLP-dependent enzyme-domain-containing protein n=1 Tax=Thelonectria olida TaxID=1576542 RepID=A0A9P8WGB5_9HYPO|nr:Cys/Met metabolism PLP-dependent enzyme-domain-containing protein [Thelonectria olida]